MLLITNPFLHNFLAKEDMVVKTMSLVKIAADCAGMFICPTKNRSSAQYKMHGLTDSVFICEKDI